MNISIFGLGYVGAVTAGCLASRGHRLTGVDVHRQKVEFFNLGISPIVEPGLDELLTRAKEKGLLRATQSCENAIQETDLSIVCVGTPSETSGALDLSFVMGVTEQIARALLDMLTRDVARALRQHYLAHYSRERFASRIRDALLRLGQ